MTLLGAVHKDANGAARGRTRAAVAGPGAGGGPWDDGWVHHLLDDLAECRVLDAGRVCDAVARIRGGAVDVDRWAQRAALLSDPGRLRICLALHCSREICVTDLAVAAQMSESATSHALRLLRADGAVAVRRDGRLALYRLVDHHLDGLLHAMGATAEHTPHAPHP